MNITRDSIHSPFTTSTLLIEHFNYFSILFDWFLPMCQNKAQGPGKRASSSFSCYYLFEDYIAHLANEAAHININQLTDIPDRNKRKDSDDQMSAKFTSV